MKYAIILALGLALVLPLQSLEAKDQGNQQESFDKKDKNHDGVLSKEEAAAKPKAGHKSGKKGDGAKRGKGHKKDKDAKKGKGHKKDKDAKKGKGHKKDKDAKKGKSHKKDKHAKKGKGHKKGKDAKKKKSEDKDDSEESA
jgi:hypothetical protein